MWTFIVLGILVTIFIIDVYCYFTGRVTLSHKIVVWTIAYPLFPFFTGLFIGVLAGHWWWPAGQLPFGF